jgi:glycosyltransferase involved in cell wall biosynthesis
VAFVGRLPLHFPLTQSTMAETTSTAEVSVIVPTKNSASTIESCLHSLKLQTFDSIESIVVDGGSTDSTLKIASRKADRLIVSDFGRTTARRKGADVAQGKYLLFLDSDQILESGVIMEVVKILADSAIDAVKIPERDNSSGFWSSCRALDRIISQAESITYPRAFRKSSYVAMGGHTRFFENYLEDRDLYLRSIGAGLRHAWSKSAIVNLVGRVNPIEIGIKGARAANDASKFYDSNRKSGESIWKVLRPRMSRLADLGLYNRELSGALLAFPVYVLLVYGPRFTRVLLQASRG